ncbi:MAG: dihydroneopterin aldolase [Gammaproteobacteria bacterium]|nr:MAG: dihydroneopterin aldolase [Gammaproteobacteria bacterium]
MARQASVELRDLQLAADIGTYGPDDVIPDAHVLDLTLTLAPEWVQVLADDMALVFDYDPLIARIDQLARDQHYETQEYLMSRIVAACADYPQITGVDISLRKGPVLQGTGSLGVRLTLGEAELAALRSSRG